MKPTMVPTLVPTMKSQTDNRRVASSDWLQWLPPPPTATWRSSTFRPTGLCDGARFMTGFGVRDEARRSGRLSSMTGLVWPTGLCDRARFNFTTSLTELGVQADWALCRNPTLAKCEGEAPTLGKVGICSPPGLPNFQTSTARGKTPRIGVFLVSLERSWNVDIENALVLAIRTSVAQVMGKRRVRSQTGSLTTDH
jgi:hypothetical protein